MIKRLSAFIISAAVSVYLILPSFAEDGKDYIKWIDFDVTEQALRDTASVDCESHGNENEYSWINLLSVLAVKYGGDFSRYRKADLDEICDRLASGCDYTEIASNEKLYNYYLDAYGAVLGGMLGSFREFTTDENGNVHEEEKYGIRAFSPIASGYYFNHYDDFGASRSYGYKRNHLGHDLMGSVGTPVIAVEAGYVEACGWNQYGGWRVGIRSFDGKRYYYYAHLRKDHPYNDIYEGKIVNAGEVIGYLGMTGYSSKENTNNINVPHLHYGMQIIFDQSQKDCWNQIWIDMYEITEFLQSYKAQVIKQDKEYTGIKYCMPDNCPD